MYQEVAESTWSPGPRFTFTWPHCSPTDGKWQNIGPWEPYWVVMACEHLCIDALSGRNDAHFLFPFWYLTSRRWTWWWNQSRPPGQRNPISPQKELPTIQGSDATDTLLLPFEGFHSSALSYLSNLHTLEFSGRTLQVGSTIPTVESQQPFSEMATLRGVDIEEPEANNVDPVWRSLHRNTLENLLRVIVRYYRGLYLFPALHLQKPLWFFSVLILRFMQVWGSGWEG
jgi:hypothetical protein